MAATTITNNSPTAGSIRWTAFNISYGGQSFPIAAGSTAAKYVFWRYNTGAASGTGAPALYSADVLPELGPDDLLLFMNKAGVGMLVPGTTILDGGLVVPGSILGTAIGADEVDTKHLAADAVEAENVAAGAITTRSLSVGTVSDNLVANGSFEDFSAGQLEGWEVAATSGGTISPVTGVSSSGAVSVQFDATSTSANLRLVQQASKSIPVSSASGRSWYVAVRMGASVAITKGAMLRVSWHAANGAWLSYSTIMASGALSTTFAVYEGQVVPPADARFARVEVGLMSPNKAAKVYVDEVVAYLVTVSARIADGAITTPKIEVDEAFATKVFAGILQGAVIETNSAPDRGVKIVDAGLLAYDNNGNETVRLDGANSIITGATVRTAAAGARIQMSGAGLEAWNASNIKYLTANSAGLELIGSISSKGQTAEATPRDINVRLTTVTRNILGAVNVPNPAVVFDDGTGGLGLAAGMYSPDGNQLVLAGKSSSITGMGEMRLSKNVAELHSRDIFIGQGGIYPTEVLALKGEAITIGESTNILGPTTRVQLRGDVTINGEPIAGQAYSREQVNLTYGWTHVTSNGWGGLWVEQQGKWTVITGCIQKGSYVWNENMATLPERYRPASKAPGLNCEIDTAGNMLPGAAGSGARNISLSYFAK